MENLCKVILLSLTVLLAGCDKENNNGYVVTDYSQPGNWLVNPEGSDNGKEADVFYLYPTTWSGTDAYCEVTNTMMREGAEQNRKSNTPAFTDMANLYMPYYRQVNADILTTLSYDEQDAKVREIPYADCIRAFEYYVENYNNGRPYILAGHSQGSNVLLFILEYLRDKPELFSRMIAAYPIGIAVTSEYMARNPHLRFAEGRDDTGVVISWNTVSEEYSGGNPIVRPNSLTINPINWKRDMTFASKEESLGSAFMENDRLVIYEHYADARIDPDMCCLVCTTDPGSGGKGSSIFPKGVMHGYDYSLYFEDLRQNVKDRINSYFKR